MAAVKEDLMASVTLGVLLWDPSSRQSEFDFEGAPHVWLTVAGRPIDNMCSSMCPVSSCGECAVHLASHRGDF